jgi:Ca2+-binding EF-hand superfamily protein
MITSLRVARFGSLLVITFGLPVLIVAQENLNGNRADSPDRTDRESTEGVARDQSPLRERYDQLDGDRSGGLSNKEFVGTAEDDVAKKLRRDFAVLDRDTNGEMSFEEFLNNPYLVPPDQRGVLQDAFHRLLSTQLQVVAAAFAAADKNRDGRLEEAELMGESLPVTPTQSLPFNTWDLNGDLQLTQNECQDALAIAYGLVRPTGEPLRFESGRVPNLMLFHHLDGNGDDKISTDEFFTNWPDTDRSASWLAAGDQNADGIVTFQEWARVTEVISDPLAEFLRMDTNFDGEVDEAELLDGTPDWQQQMARYVFPGFDQDGNGALSLQEFQLLPQVNPIAVWHHPRQDTDDDGYLNRSEFRWHEGLFLAGLSNTYFDFLDVNDDGRIGQDEYFFYTNRRDPEQELQHRDTDGDGLLSLEEFTVGAEGPERQRLERNFRAVDFDGSGTLDVQEFANLPDVFPPSQRGSVPDSVVAMVTKHLRNIEQNWAAWDGNEDGSLTSDEFAKSNLSRSVPGMAMTAFPDWDVNGDQQVSIGEVRRMLEISFGVRRPTGELLRLASGRVPNQMLFEHLDRDGNQRVTRQEFLENWEEPERSQRWLEEADVNGDDAVDFVEWSTVAEVTADPLAEFLRMDTNFDGAVDRRELLEWTPDWQRMLAKYAFPGFDVDSDNVLSFSEFQPLPQVNPVAPWHLPRQDSNRDGMLSRAEFQWTEGGRLAGLTEELFQRLDVNGDGRLDVMEWHYVVRPEDIPHQQLFAYLNRDSDGALTLQEAMGNLDPESHAKADPHWSLRLLRAEEAFRLADEDGNGLLDAQEFDETSAKAIMSPDLSQQTGNLASVVTGQKDDVRAQSEWPWWGWMLLVDAVLVVGVAVFLVWKRH